MNRLRIQLSSCCTVALHNLCRVLKYRAGTRYGAPASLPPKSASASMTLFARHRPGTTIILLNLLIAKMNQTYSTVMQKANEEYQMNFAEVRAVVAARRLVRRLIPALRCGLAALCPGRRRC